MPNHVDIAAVSNDASGRLSVAPAPSSNSDFAFIYRVAKEVAWNPETGALVGGLPRTWSRARWFQQIAEAVGANTALNCASHQARTGLMFQTKTEEKSKHGQSKPNNPFNPIAAKTRLRVNGTLGLRRTEVIFAFVEGGTLQVYETIADAISHHEGVDVESGVVSFYDENGTYLEPRFSTPNERGKVLGVLGWVQSGTYELVPNPATEEDSFALALYETLELEPNNWFGSLEQLKANLSAKGVEVEFKSKKT